MERKKYRRLSLWEMPVFFRSVFFTLFFSASAGDFAVLITFRNFRKGLT